MLSLFPRFILFFVFYPFFRVLSLFPRFIPFSAFYPFFRVLSLFPRFIPFSASAIPYFRNSGSVFYPNPFYTPVINTFSFIIYYYAKVLINTDTRCCTFTCFILINWCSGGINTARLTLWQYLPTLKALSHDAIFLATCNAILLLGDVKLANTSFHQSLLMYF